MHVCSTITAYIEKYRNAEVDIVTEQRKPPAVETKKNVNKKILKILSQTTYRMGPAALGEVKKKFLNTTPHKYIL